jgi:hypothetical protein
MGIAATYTNHGEIALQHHKAYTQTSPVIDRDVAVVVVTKQSHK